MVRRYWEAWRGGSVHELQEFWHPDIEWRAIEGAPDDVGEMHGREAHRAYYQDWVDMFDDLRATPLEVIDAGGNQVVSVQHVSGRAKLSGAETTLDYAIVYTIRDGVIGRGKEYATRTEALEGVGLRE